MAHIYLSSSYIDLKDAREKVYRALRKMRHDVIAMEDYVAMDQRPLDKCLVDVANCDIYVGIFAWRYGYIPDGREKSITELEFRQAVLSGKPCLLFLLQEDAPWPRNMIDRDSKNIEALRAEIGRDYMVSFFRSEDDLVTSVTVAVADLKLDEQNGNSVSTRNGSPQPVGRLSSISGMAAGNRVFSDDFSSSELDSCWQPVSGDWYIKDGVLNGVGSHYVRSNSREWAAITLDKEIPNDCSISFRTRLIDGSTAELMLHLSNNRYIRIYIYEIDQGIYFGDGTFVEDDRPGEIGLQEVLGSIGGGPTLAAHSFPVKMNVWYGITATASGNKYTVKVGGIKLIEYLDTKKKLPKEGSIGFLTNGHVQFDEVVITARS